MANVFEVWHQGCSRPVYTYKTYTGLRKRLEALAQHSALSSVQVNVGGEQIKVRLFRGKNGYGWETAVGRGIPHHNGLRQSAFSRSW